MELMDWSEKIEEIIRQAGLENAKSGEKLDGKCTMHYMQDSQSKKRTEYP